jgi:hypothetical protein
MGAWAWISFARLKVYDILTRRILFRGYPGLDLVLRTHHPAGGLDVSFLERVVLAGR